MDNVPVRLLYSRQEAATMLNISLSGLDKLIRAGRLKTVHVGRRRRLILLKTLQAFIAKAKKGN